MIIKYLGDSSLTQEELNSCGGKASRLHELKAAGFTVPAGFILRTSEAEVASAVDKIGGFPVAVRSSCSLEDLSNASFAGLYETFLNVQTLEDLHRRIEECFYSKESERVKDYLHTKGLAEKIEQLQMNVLVQKMIQPRLAGVLFTLNPTTGRQEEYYLEFCSGVGERLVSGLVTPSSCVFDVRNRVRLKDFINNEGTVIENSSLLELIEEAKKIQAHFGSPQDIEWAIDDMGKVHILQSRPITTISFRQDVPELTNADLRDGGISARVCTPLMFSAYRNALQFSMAQYFKSINLIPYAEDVTWIYHLYGRVYWNAGAVKEGLKNIPGYHEADFDRDLGIQKDYGPNGPVQTSLSISSLVKALPVLLGLNREFRDCEVMVDQFRVRFEERDQELKNQLNSLAKLDEEDFRKWFLEVILFHQLTERNYFRTIYNNSNFQTEFKARLKKIPGYQEGDEIELMSQISGIAHIEVQKDLASLVKKAEFFGLDSSTYFQERERFLRSHYHHGPAELDLTVPRWGEKKEWVDDLVRSFSPSPLPSGTHYQNVCQRLLRSLSRWSRSRFQSDLKRSRNFLKLREEMRTYSTRAYYLLRQGLLEFGRRRKIPEHLIFMFDLSELQIMLSGQEVQVNLEERYLEYLGFRTFEAPNEFGGAIKQLPIKPGSLRGVGCSPGVKEGRARVILDIHQTGSLTHEDILVTVFTDPGWTPVLARVGGVVTEVGGLLSHAAVIGREYGIPAILNLPGVTKTIRDGSLIRINGKSGEIEVLEEGP